MGKHKKHKKKDKKAKKAKHATFDDKDDQVQLQTIKFTMAKLKKQDVPVEEPPKPKAKPKLPETKHPCAECNLEFGSEALLNQHKRSHQKKLFYCPHCPVVCDNAPKLKRHNVVHTGERPYTCDICQKSFGLEWNMKLHRRIHFHEKPFICELCGKCFAQRSNFKLHQQVHGHAL
jgi:uncharacterized Zn-finger protein